jgi:signal transduction histidine kinase
MDVAVDVPKGASLKLISEICSVYENKTELVTPTVGKRLNFGGQGNVNKAKIYTPNDFTDSKIKPGDIAITSPAIVIPLGTPVKAFVVDNRNETLYSPYSTLILIPDESVVLPQYLSIQLSEGYIADQVGVGFMRFVPIDFINRLKIVVPSLEEQRAFVNNYQASLVNKLGIEVDQLKTQQVNEFERNMHLRKHALKQVLNEVVPASRRIANFISSQEGAFCKDVIIAERSKSTLNEYSQKLFRNVEKIQRLIAALTDDENYPEAKTFDFATFVAVYRHKKITDDKYRLLWFGESHFFGDEPEMPTDVAPGDHREIQAAQLTAHIAPTALETVLDNLIANAVNHGFVDDQRMDYGIKILFTNILVEGTMMLEVRVMNNGAKLPDGMTPDRVFTWGIGSGTGLGSWQVKNIIEHYGGSVEFIQHDDAPDGYNIEYRIVIPMS